MTRSRTTHAFTNTSTTPVDTGTIDSIRRPIDDAIYHEEQEQLFINQDVTLEWKCEQTLQSFQRYTFRHSIDKSSCDTAKMYKLMICNDALKSLNSAAIYASITVVEHGQQNSRIYKEIFNKRVWISAKQSVTYMLTINDASSVYIQLQSFAFFMKTPVAIRLLQSHCESAAKQIRFIIDDNTVSDQGSTASGPSAPTPTVEKGIVVAARNGNEKITAQNSNIKLMPTHVADRQSNTTSAVELTDTDECTDDDEFFETVSNSNPPPRPLPTTRTLVHTTIIENHF
jgi:hypothetical protein